jgi:PST family polysaccharide transporter
MQLATPAVALVLTWSISGWRPEWPKRNSGTRSLVSFGVDLSMSSFLWSIARSVDALLIGRFYGAGELGLYTRAGALLSRPVDQLIGPVARVVVPTLSRLQLQPERYRRVLLEVFEITAVVSFWLTGVVLALSEPITALALGPQWEGAAAIFAGFSLVALYTPVASVGSWLLTSQGRGREFLRQSVIASSLKVVGCVVGLPFGPVGVAVGYSTFCMLVALPLTYHIAGRRGPVCSRDLWLRFFRHLPIWFVVCAGTFLTYEVTKGMQLPLQLAICAGGGLLVGFLFILAYRPSRKVARGGWSLLSELRGGRGIAMIGGR